MPDPFDAANERDEPDYSSSDPELTSSFKGKKRKKYRKDKKQEIGSIDRQPPYNMEAEVGVIGSMLLMPEICDDIVNLLRPEDFYDEANQRLFFHLMEMHGGGKKIDPVLLRERLVAHDELELIGGPGRLAEIFSAVPNAAHATYYANIVRGKATSRNIITTLSLIHISEPTRPY